MLGNIPGKIYLFKVNNRNIRKRREICSNSTIKTPFSCVSVVDFEQVNVCRDIFENHIQFSCDYREISSSNWEVMLPGSVTSQYVSH